MSASTPRVIWHPWRILREPPLLSGLYSLAYAGFIVAGVAWVLDPRDDVIAYELGVASGYLMSWLWVAGGLLGVMSMIKGLWFAERSGLWFCIGGLLGRAFIITQTPIESGERALMLALIATFTFLLLARIFSITGADLSPYRG